MRVLVGLRSPPKGPPWPPTQSCTHPPCTNPSPHLPMRATYGPPPHIPRTHEACRMRAPSAITVEVRSQSVGIPTSSSIEQLCRAEPQSADSDDSHRNTGATLSDISKSQEGPYFTCVPLVGAPTERPPVPHRGSSTCARLPDALTGPHPITKQTTPRSR